MSTISSQLLVSSSSLTEDFYRLFLRKNASERETVNVGRIAVALVALVAIFIARDPDSKVLGLVSNAWAGFGAAFGPLILLSLTWSRMTGAGAETKMMADLVDHDMADQLFEPDAGMFHFGQQRAAIKRDIVPLPARR